MLSDEPHVFCAKKRLVGDVWFGALGGPWGPMGCTSCAVEIPMLKLSWVVLVAPLPQGLAVTVT